MVANARLFHIRYRNVVDITYISGKASATVASQLELEDCSSLCIIYIPALSRAVLRAEMALPPNQHVIYMFSLCRLCHPRHKVICLRLRFRYGRLYSATIILMVVNLVRGHKVGFPTGIRFRVATFSLRFPFPFWQWQVTLSHPCASSTARQEMSAER